RFKVQKMEFCQTTPVATVERVLITHKQGCGHRTTLQMRLDHHIVLRQLMSQAQEKIQVEIARMTTAFEIGEPVKVKKESPVLFCELVSRVPCKGKTLLHYPAPLFDNILALARTQTGEKVIKSLIVPVI